MQIAASDNVLDGRILCSVNQAARALSVSVRTVNAYLAAKHLVSRKVGRRRLVVVMSLKAFASKDQPGLSPWSGAAVQKSRSVSVNQGEPQC
jgi:excisionase family DNA binding protein